MKYTSSESSHITQCFIEYIGKYSDLLNSLALIPVEATKTEKTNSNILKHDSIQTSFLSFLSLLITNLILGKKSVV